MTSTPPTASPTSATVSYTDLARLFLKMSIFAFGGPAAHIAMGADEIVVRRRWMTREDYLDIVAAANLIPGPNSTETMIHVGYRMRGNAGAVLAGACFIIPAMLITLAITAVYAATGQLPAAVALLWGIQPVILAIIAYAAYQLMPAALKNRRLWALFALSLLVLFFTDIPEVVVMLASGLIYALITTARSTPSPASFALYWGAMRTSIYERLGQTAQIGDVLTIAEIARPFVSLWDLFFYFFKIGSVLFGSGYVLITYIQQDLVNTFGWLSARELLDAVAIGQFTPGPVLTTATAVGYLISGVGGALAATAGVFLPSFILVILTAPLLPRMKRSRFLSAFLMGANAAVIAAMIGTVIGLTGEAFRALNPASLLIGTISLIAVGLFAFALFALYRLKWNATVLILLGAGAGILTGALGG